MLDGILVGAIIAGAVYLLYRNLWKKKHCSGCNSQDCPTRKMAS